MADNLRNEEEVVARQESEDRLVQEYTIIEPLGNGKDGLVLSVIPRAEADKFQQIIRASSLQDLKQTLQDPRLASFDVSAVKLIGNRDLEWAKEETAVVSYYLPMHSSIPRFTCPEPRGFWYTTKQYGGGTLTDAIQILKRRPPPALFWHMIAETLSALIALHNYNLVHCDGHLGNFMFDPSNRTYRDYPSVVLIDHSRTSFAGQVRRLDTRDGAGALNVRESNIDQFMQNEFDYLTSWFHRAVHRIRHGADVTRDKHTGACTCELAYVKYKGMEICGGFTAHEFFLQMLELLSKRQERDTNRVLAVIRQAEQLRDEMYVPVPPVLERHFKDRDQQRLRAAEILRDRAVEPSLDFLKRTTVSFEQHI
ncbi:MAG: hypothetical protein M1828_000710 [Chrysothrix sp. TS-e1954]|nr:MAG: hypothetical protein M1828_000710 [Chrysothrix sp. TS-e1954]